VGHPAIRAFSSTKPARLMGSRKSTSVRRREKKIALIEKMNPRWQDLAENWRREMLFPGQSLNAKDQSPEAGEDKPPR
jgi:hypothetical protein